MQQSSKTGKRDKKLLPSIICSLFIHLGRNEKTFLKDSEQFSADISPEQNSIRANNSCSDVGLDCFFHFANIFSIGLRNGEYEGKKSTM